MMKNSTNNNNKRLSEKYKKMNSKINILFIVGVVFVSPITLGIKKGGGQSGTIYSTEKA